MSLLSVGCIVGHGYRSGAHGGHGGVIHGSSRFIL